MSKEIVEMPAGAGFRRGIRFDELYAALTPVQQSRAGSWPSRLRSMGFRMESAYCSHKKDINKRIAGEAPNPQKVCARDVARKYPDVPQTETAADRDHNVAGESAPASAPTGGTAPELACIELNDDEVFVGTDGRPMTIRAYGE